MQQLVKGLIVGAASGVATYFASIQALGYTMAIAMPRGFPLALWDAVVFLGLGATLVALIVHLIATRLLAAPAAPALVGFAVAAAVALAVTGQLELGYKALVAWLIGAALASAVQRWLWPNNSVKGMPLRGTPYLKR